MGTKRIRLNEKQKEAILWLHRMRPLSGCVHRNDLVFETAINEQEFVDLYKYLDRLGHVIAPPLTFHTTDITVFRVKDSIAKEVDRIVNEPELDYLTATKKWFNSKWWSVPILGIAVVMPTLVGYVAMLKTLLAWMSSGE